jgi:uncharacterized protein Usg
MNDIPSILQKFLLNEFGIEASKPRIAGTPKTSCSWYWRRTIRGKYHDLAFYHVTKHHISLQGYTISWDGGIYGKLSNDCTQGLLSE